MRRTIRPIITVTLGCILALLSAALTYSTYPAMQGTFVSNAAFFLSSTSTPPAQELTEIGSTDGIVIMGFLIVLIIIIPILVRRKSWMQNH
jgi:hypothetical protein